MRLPRRLGALDRITDFTAWKTAVEDVLTDLDRRQVSAGYAGAVVAYTGPGALPRGMLSAAGQTVARADYPRLFARIGTTYNTGGESSSVFRLPNFTTPPQHGVWVILT